MLYGIMARGRIGIQATPNTELPMIISNRFLPINIITKRSIPDAAGTLNSPLVIAMQNSPTIILLDSGQHAENFPSHLYALLTEFVKFPVFKFLRYHLTGNMKIFYPFYVEIYFSTTIAL